MMTSDSAVKTGESPRLPEREEDLRCLICEKVVTDGITIRGRRICSECERDLVDLPVEDPAYDGYLARIKALWPNLPENGH
ncbi:MAG: sigma factor G inhibitor Gin [Syntrophothermus sp.]